MAAKRSPGGVGDGLPSLPSGEPVLARWFVIAMLILVPIGIGISAFAWLSTDREVLGVAERRPPGDAQVTHLRGEAQLGDIRDEEDGPGCASGIRLVGDAGARAAARRAMGATCQLLERGSFPQAERGLEALAERDGAVRFAVFEASGVDASSRVAEEPDDDGRPPVYIELNARFQFRDGTEAAPFVLHELVHLGGDWPGQPVDAADELAAMQDQAAACDRLSFRPAPPRGCRDAQELADADDALRQLRDAGYGSGS